MLTKNMSARAERAANASSRSPLFSLSRTLIAGLTAGAAAGLLAALLTPLLRRWAGVSDRDLVNGASVVGLSLLLWLLSGLAVWLLASRVRQPETIAIAAAAAVGALAFLAILADVGPAPLTPYPTRLASLAAPLIAIVTLSGAAVLLIALRTPLAIMRAAAVAAAAAALVAGGIVYGADRPGTVHYTLTIARSAAQTASQAAPQASASDPGGAAGAAASAATAPAAAAASALHFAIGSSSEASYTVNEKISFAPAPADAIGKTQTISGDIWLTPQGLDTNHPSSVTVDLRTLKSDQSRRDQYLLTDSLESNTYPNAVFTIQSISGFPTNYQQGTAVNVTLDGVFAVHGQEQPLTWTGSAVYDGKQLEVVMSTQFDMSSFGITPPNTPVVQAKSGVKLDVHLYAQQQPG